MLGGFAPNWMCQRHKADSTQRSVTAAASVERPVPDVSGDSRLRRRRNTLTRLLLDGVAASGGRITRMRRRLSKGRRCGSSRRTGFLWCSQVATRCVRGARLA